MRFNLTQVSKFTKKSTFKFNTILILSLIIVSVTLSIITSNSIKKQISNVEIINIKRRISRLADFIDNIITTGTTEIHLLSENRALIEAYKYNNMDVMGSVLIKYNKKTKYLKDIFIIDRNGFLLANDSGNIIEGNVGNTDFYLKLKGELSGFYISNIPVKSPITGEYVIILAQSITENGQWIGVVASALDLTTYAKIQTENKQYNKIDCPFIFSDQGVMVAPNKEDIFMTDYYNESVPIQQVIESMEDHGLNIYEHNKIKMYMSFTKMRSIPWYIATIINEDDIIINSDFLTIITTVTTILSIILISIAIIFYLFYIIILRIKTLEKELPDSSRKDSIISLLPRRDDGERINKL